MPLCGKTMWEGVVFAADNALNVAVSLLVLG